MLYTEPKVQTFEAVAPRSTADGSPAEMPVFVAHPEPTGEKRPGLILLQEIFGVNDHIRDVCRRFASMGYVVVAPDIFHRSGHWIKLGYDQFSEARPLVGTLTEELVVGDIAAALDFLTGQDDVDATRIGVVGYCFGGRMSFISAARFQGRIKAAAIYYGGGIASNQTSEAWPVPPLTRTGDIKCPVIAFFGALDKHIPQEAVAALDESLQAHGVAHSVHYYPYADHGFFCDARATYHPRAAQDAWHRTMWFFGKHLGPVPSVPWNQV